MPLVIAMEGTVSLMIFQTAVIVIKMAMSKAPSKAASAATGVTTETVRLTDNGNDSSFERSSGIHAVAIIIPNCNIGITQANGNSRSTLPSSGV